MRAASVALIKALVTSSSKKSTINYVSNPINRRLQERVAKGKLVYSKICLVSRLPRGLD